MILIVDCETTGLDPKNDELLELGMAGYDERLGMTWCKSVLVQGEGNRAVDVNHIDPGLRRYGEELSRVHDIWRWAASPQKEIRATVAHNASFDSRWLPERPGIPWVCSLNGIKWPNGSGKLETLALNHGVAVLPGHRALPDVLTLVRVFDAIRQAYGPQKVEWLIDDALLPRDEWRSLHPFGANEQARGAGFAWDGARKGWYARLTDTEAADVARSYPFQMAKMK